MAKVFIGMPSYGSTATQAVIGILGATAKHDFTFRTECGSLLALVFNRLWCHCLNAQKEQGYTHFAMHHADVQAEPLWLDVLLDEMERVQADILSVVIPIKDNRGLTSTGWMDHETGLINRFTMREVMGLPETFDAAGCGHPDDYLMVNTGLWVCRLDRPQFRRLCFSILDSVREDPETGILTAHSLPEDWHFSRWAAEQNLRVFVTRKVPVVHWGINGWTNTRPWGDWETDQGDNLAA